MFKTSSTAVIAILIAAAFPAAANAAARDSDVRQRQAVQQQRMHQGLRTGDLTRGEHRSLQFQARDIQREERGYRSDGHYTRSERGEVHRDLNQLSRNIYNERHDGQRRNAAPNPSSIHPGFARFDGHDVDRAQRIQRERIEHGIRTGQLTRHEAGRLVAEQRMIASEERAYRADGVLTPWERRDLWQDLNAAGRHINQEAHDGQQYFRQPWPQR